MNSSVIIFPGSNCDRDMAVALKKFGFKNKMVWHEEVDLPKSDLVVLFMHFFVWPPAVGCGHVSLEWRAYDYKLRFQA